MKNTLYSETRRACTIMTANPIAFNTQEKRKALSEIGKENAKTIQKQNAAAGTLMAQTKFRIWDENPIGTDDGKTAVTEDKGTRIVSNVLAFAAGFAAIVLILTIGKKMLKKGRKHGK